MYESVPWSDFNKCTSLVSTVCDRYSGIQYTLMIRTVPCVFDNIIQVQLYEPVLILLISALIPGGQRYLKHV